VFYNNKLSSNIEKLSKKIVSSLDKNSIFTEKLMKEYLLLTILKKYSESQKNYNVK